MKRLIFISVLLFIESFLVLAQNSTPVFYQEITWSPNGKYLSFTTYRQTSPQSNKMKSEVYAVKADGTGMRRVAENAQWSSWSGNGKRIAFSRPSEDKKTADIFSVASDGSGVVQLTNGSNVNSHPAYSPDGKKIAFTSRKGSEKPQIYIMNSDGSAVTRVTSNENAGCINPVWSPDSKRIIFFAEKGDNKDQIWSIDSDGRNPKLLTNDVGHNTYPAWFAGGDRVIFISTRDGGLQGVYTMNSDGSNVKPLAGIASFFARVAPNGKRIAFITGQFPKSEIMIGNIDGSKVKELFPK